MAIRLKSTAQPPLLRNKSDATVLSVGHVLVCEINPNMNRYRGSRMSDNKDVEREKQSFLTAGLVCKRSNSKMPKQLHWPMSLKAHSGD